MLVIELGNLGSCDSGEAGEKYGASTASVIHNGQDGIVASALW